MHIDRSSDVVTTPLPSERTVQRLDRASGRTSDESCDVRLAHFMLHVAKTSHEDKARRRALSNLLISPGHLVTAGLQRRNEKQERRIERRRTERSSVGRGS